MQNQKPPQHNIFMGAYSVDQWIQKIIQGEIELPEYQRTFRWDEQRAEKFLDTLTKHYYVPPITLGELDGKIWLLDGQQRLTTLLCLKHKIWPTFPDKKTIQVEEDGEEIEINSTSFTFTQLQTDKPITDNIQELIQTGQLKKSELCLENTENIFIPYCFISWKKDSNEEYKKDFYAHTFDRINTGGLDLNRKEVREALYWIYPDMNSLFKDVGFESSITIKTVNSDSLDYIEFLSLALSNSDVALKGALYSRSDKSKLEKYISDFIIAVKEKKETLYWSKESLERVTQHHFGVLKREFNKIEIVSFSSIAELDIYLLGLIYQVYNGYVIDDNQINECKKELTNAINNAKDKPKSINAKKYVVERLQKSIEIWKIYTIKAPENV